MTPEQKELLTTWYLAIEQAKPAKELIAVAQALSKQVAEAFFPDPKEGVNSVELDADWKLKLTYKIDRKVDEAALTSVKEQLRERNVNLDPLIRMKPELATAAYKSLLLVDPESVLIFDQALIIKSASPTLELIPPKEKT